MHEPPAGLVLNHQPLGVEDGVLISPIDGQGPQAVDEPLSQLEVHVLARAESVPFDVWGTWKKRQEPARSAEGRDGCV
jgi:hypothetical protein